MALSKGSIALKFAGGIETKMAPEAVPSARLLALENGVFTRAVSIRKRNGYEALTEAIDATTADPAAIIRLASRDDELIGFTASKCYSHEPEENRWTELSGGVYSVVGTDRAAVRTGTEQTEPDHATTSGVSVYAWEDSRGGVWYSVIDDQGHIHRGPVQADADGISPRCVAIDGNVVAFYVNSVQGFLYAIVVNPARPDDAVTPVLVADDVSTTNPVYDVCPTERTGTPAAIAWNERGTTNLRLGYVNSAGILGTPLAGLPSVITDAVGLDAASPIGVAFSVTEGTPNGDFLVAYMIPLTGITAATGIVKQYRGGDSLTPITVVSAFDAYASPTSVQRVAIAVSDHDDENRIAWVAFEETAVAASNRYAVINSIEIDSSIVGTERTQRSVGLASRAWRVSGGEDVFAYFVHDTTYFNVYLALRLSDSLCVARTLPGRAGDAPARRHLPSAHVAESVVRVALPYNERVESENDDEFTETGIRIVTLDFDDDDSHQHAQLGRGLYLGGACPMHYDGRQWTEQGFHVGPELIATVNGSSGSLTAGSTYLYRCWYEWPDALGEIHRGPVSFGTLVTLGGGEDEVTLTLPTLRVTAKSNVRIVVARSRAAETGATAELFVCSSRDPSTAGAANGYVANTTSADTVSFNDRMSDATLATQEPAYTNGGILSTDPSSLGHIVAEGKGRLFYNDPSDPDLVAYTQLVEDGYAVEAPPELRLRCPPAGGAITALAVGEDGAVLVFKPDAIFAFSGAGPLPNGDTAAQGFSDPVRLRSPVGCEEPASIAIAPAAILFKSAQGIWQVDGAGQVTYVGAPVEAYNDQRITAATPMPDRTQIVFLTDSGYTLLYDYLFGQWSTFTNHEGLDALVTQDTYHYLRATGRVYRETVGAYSDAGARITLRLETAWIHIAEALQGFQRIWSVLVLGTWISPHQLAISHRTDYAPGQLPTSDPSAWSDPVYLDASGEDAGSVGWIEADDGDNPIGEDPILGDDYGDGVYGDGDYGGEGADVYQWRYDVGERGQAIQLRFEDYERSGLAGAAFELTELLIEGGVAGPSKKPFNAARSG
jgi:hypothetical protein